MEPTENQISGTDTERKVPVSADSQYVQAITFLEGKGVTVDPGMAAACFLNAADMGDSKGMYSAGMMYLKGIGVTANRDTAVDFLTKANALNNYAAKNVLLALKQGKDCSHFPIVAPDNVDLSSSTEDGEGRGAAIAPKANPVTPGKVLVIVGGIVLAIGALGGGYYVYAKKQAEQQEMARVAEQTRMAEEERRRAEEQRLREEEQKRLEAEKQRLAAEEASLQAKADAIRKQEEIQKAEAARLAEAAKARVEVTPPPAQGRDTWRAHLDQALPHLKNMLNAGPGNNADLLQREAAQIRALPQPPRGDRRMARSLNQDGLDALRKNDFARAASILTNAASTDMSDEEVANNLGFALMRSGRSGEAQASLFRSLSLNPVRSSAWFNLGQLLAGANNENGAYSSFLLAYRFSGNQEKTKEWLNKLAQEDPDSRVRAAASRTLGSTNVRNAPAPAPAPAATSNVMVQDPRQKCANKDNFISKSLCESKACQKQEYMNHPFCERLRQMQQNRN